MQYKTIFLMALVSFLFIQCSKKTSDVVQGPVDQTWRSSVPKPGAAREIQLGDYKSFELDNGLKVIVVENHKLPRVSYQVSLINEPILEGEKAGYISMAGSLMSTGTEKRTKAELDKTIDFIGASVNTSGSGVFASSLTKHQDKLLDVMTEMLFKPSFPKEEFDKLKKQTLSGLTAAKADPNSMASNVAAVLNYGKDHPYGEIQTEKSLDKITIEDCKSYYNNYFKPNNAYLIIVGDINIDEARMKAQRYFSSWKKGEVSQSIFPTPAPPSGNKVAFAHKDGAVQAVIRVTHPVQLRPGDEDVVKVSVMNAVLGGGVFLGRLMQNLREDKGYTYGARSSLSSDPLVATFNASASVRNEVADSSVTEFLYEIERMKTDPISSKDLQLAKNSLAGSFARALESPQTMASFARNTFRYNLPPDYYSTYLSRLDAITIQDVKMVAEKYLRPNGANIVIVGNKDEIADKLLPFDSDVRIDYYDAFGNEIKMDNTSIPEGVTAETVINDYIEAIGGKGACNAVKTVKNEMTMAVMGQEASVMLQQKMPNKLSLTITMQGMTLQEQKFDGEKALTAQMGQKKILTEGAEFESIKNQAEIFPQLSYKKNTLELKGIEDVEGVKAYKILVTSPQGKTTTEFYALSSNLLIRTTSTQEGPGGQQISTITDVSEYKEVGGVLMPHKLTISGAMPQPLTMQSKGMEVNGPIDDAVFKVEE